MLWRRFRRKADEHAPVSVGIAVESAQVDLVAFDGEVEGRPEIVAWEVRPFEGAAELQQTIESFVDTHGLAGQGCRIVLPIDHYSLRLIERPANVPDEELADATRWLVRDLIEFDVESAELALFSVPEDSSRARTPRMFVAAARHESVMDLAHMVDAAGLRLVGIDTVESAMLSLEARLPSSVAGGALLWISDKASVLTLAYEQNLYLARTLNIDVHGIERAAELALGAEDPTGPEVIAAVDELLLDIQRSLDYYESEYGQAPASRLTLLPSEIDMTPLLPALAEALRPIQVELFESDRLFEYREMPSGQTAPALALAAGAALAGPEPLGDALVPQSFRDRSDGFGLVSAARVVGAIAALLLLYFGYAEFQLRGEREAYAALEAQQQSLSEQVALERARADERAAAWDPEAELERLRAERQSGLAMLRDIDQRSRTNRASFSTLLSALARQDLEGIWLERIALGQGGDTVRLEGRSLRTEDVPRFLRRLGREPGFADRRFKAFEMDRGGAAEPGIGFRVGTERPEDEDEGAKG